jgi:hypothetical protein
VLLSSAGLVGVVNDLNGIWSAISAVCTGAAVLVAVWATRRVLEQGQKSQLKDELRSVREAQSALLAARGAFKAAIHAYWKRPSATEADSEDPFASEQVRQEAQVHQAAYDMEAAAWVLVGAIRGAHALGSRLWEEDDVERLADFIEAYGRKGWLPNYLALVATLERGTKLSRFSLVYQVTDGASRDMDDFATRYFSTDGRLSGFPTTVRDARLVTDGFIDAALARIREGVNEFLRVGDRAAETLKPLSRFRPSSFLSEGGWGSAPTAPDGDKPSTSAATFELARRQYSGSSLAEIIGKAWPDHAYDTLRRNDLLARAWREWKLVAVADERNRALRAAAADGRFVLSQREADFLDRLIDGEKVVIRWRHTAFPLTTVKGRMPTHLARSLVVLDPETERSFLESIGELRMSDSAPEAALTP